MFQICLVMYLRTVTAWILGQTVLIQKYILCMLVKIVLGVPAWVQKHKQIFSLNCPLTIWMPLFCPCFFCMVRFDRLLDL